MEETTFKWDGGLLLDYLSRMRFRLKASARHRLALDIAALCTGLRAVVMVDYAREVSQLQSQLCKLLHLLAQEIRLITSLKVMCVDDAVYLIHVDNFSMLMDETLNHSIELEFVVLDDAVVRFALPREREEALNHFASFKSCFLIKVSKGMRAPEVFPHYCLKPKVADITCESVALEPTCEASQSSIVHKSSSSFGIIDLGSCQTCCEAAFPTLNGWLLGYPVIYLFKKENISKAVRTLSVSTLHQYKILIQSSLAFKTSEVQGQKGRPAMHELTSFTLPSELSTQGVGEEWAISFMQSMQMKVKNSQMWKSLELQVTSQICQSVVL